MDSKKQHYYIDKKRQAPEIPEPVSFYVRQAIEYLLALRLNIRRDELIALAVNIDDLYRRIVLQMLAQLGDVNIHAAGIEIIVIDPYRFQRKVTLKDLIDMSAKETEKL